MHKALSHCAEALPANASVATRTTRAERPRDLAGAWSVMIHPFDGAVDRPQVYLTTEAGGQGMLGGS